MLRRSAAALVLSAGLSGCGFVGGAPTPIGPVTGSRAPIEVEVSDPAPFVRGTMRPYQIRGRWYTPELDEAYDRTGVASWYGEPFHGRPTATGEIFDMNALTAAHTTLPLPSLVEVTNLDNGRTVVLRVNDRGPFIDDRLIDLSRAAADALGVRSQGLGRVRVRYVGPAPRGGGGGRVLTGGETVIRAEAPVVAAPPSSEPALDPAQGVGAWFVQVGTFGEPANAEALRSRIGRTDRVRVEPVEVSGRQLFRVLVGPWGGRQEAERQRSRLAGQGLFDAVLVRAE